MRRIQISRGCEEEEVKEFGVKTEVRSGISLGNTRKSICVSKHRGRCRRGDGELRILVSIF